MRIIGATTERGQVEEVSTARERLAELQELKVLVRYNQANTKSRVTELREQIAALDNQRRSAIEYLDAMQQLMDRLSREELELQAKLEEEPDLTSPEMQRALAKLKEIHGVDQNTGDILNYKPYQLQAIIFILDRHFRPRKTKGAIEGDDTGLGKTAIVAGLLQLMENEEQFQGASN